MFVGHLAVAFAGKRLSPSTPLGWFVAAASTPDLLWPVLLLLGVERVSITPGATAFNPLVFDHYPWSHSLVMDVAWGAALAAVAGWRGVDAAGRRLVALLVVSHWVLDWVTHAPDLPLWPGPSPRLGLGLWNSIPATYLVEGAMWVAALLLYLRERRASGLVAHVALWSFVLVTTGLWATGPFGPPPPSVNALAGFALFGAITIPWAAWVDRTWRRSAGDGDA